MGRTGGGWGYRRDVGYRVHTKPKVANPHWHPTVDMFDNHSRHCLGTPSEKNSDDKQPNDPKGNHPAPK